MTEAFGRLEASIQANTLDPQALQDLSDIMTADSAAIDTADAVALATGGTPVTEPPVTEPPTTTV